MLVDVVRMRDDGVKLPGDVVRSTPPVRGRLVIVTVPWRAISMPHLERTDTTFVRLLQVPLPTSADEGPLLLPELRDGRFRKWDGQQGVIVGIETNYAKTVDCDRAQAWWCRLSG